MKNFKFKWLLLSIVLSIASINTAWADGGYYSNTDIWGVNFYFNGDGSSWWKVNSTSASMADWSKDPLYNLTLRGFYVNVYSSVDMGIKNSKMYYRFYKDGDTAPAFSETSSASHKSNNGGTNGWWEGSQHQTWELTGADINLFNNVYCGGTHYFNFYIFTEGAGWLNNGCSDCYYSMKFNVPERVFACDYGSNQWSSTARQFSNGKYVLENVAGNTTINFKIPFYNNWSTYVFNWSNVGGNTALGNTTLNPGDDSRIQFTTPLEYASNVVVTFTGSTVAVNCYPRYSVSVDAGAHGHVSPSSVNNIDAGGVPSEEITATADDGYYFTHWTLPDGVTAAEGYTYKSNPIKIYTTAAGKTITANFARKWTVKGGNSDREDGSDAFGDWKIYHDLEEVETNVFEGSVTLAANTTYQFKVVDAENDKYYSYGETSDVAYYLSYVGQSGDTGYDLEENRNNIRLMSAGAGSYKFRYNSSTHRIQVIFPTTDTHPSTNYIYFKHTQGWKHDSYVVLGHVFGTNESCGKRMPVVDSIQFDGKYYYYMALGDNTKAIFAGSQNTTDYKTEDLTGLGSDGTKRGKYYDVTSGANESARWQDFKVTITLDNQDADVAGTTSVNPIYNSDVLSNITIPEKDGYRFDGYYSETNGSGSMLINSSGEWQTVSGYTDVSKHWIRKSSETLYAKWTNSAYIGKYTFHYETAADTWTIRAFTQRADGRHWDIEGFEVPNHNNTLKFYVGYEGWPSTTMGESAHYQSSRECTWNELSNSTKHYGYMSLLAHSDLGAMVIAGDTRTAVGAKGTLTINTDNLSPNLGVGFRPSGYQLTVKDSDGSTRTLNFTQTNNPDIWETDILETGLTAKEVHTDARYKVSIATDDSYVDCYLSDWIDTSYINANKDEYDPLSYEGKQTYPKLTAEAKGRFQLVLTSQSVTNYKYTGVYNYNKMGFALRYVPLKNWTISFGKWNGRAGVYQNSLWSLGHQPTIDEDVVIYNSIEIDSPNAQAKSVLIDKKTPSSKYFQLDIAPNGALFVKESLQAIHVDEDEARGTTSSDLKLESDYTGNATLIVGSKSINSESYYEYFSKSYRIRYYGYINQFIGIPFKELDTYNFYNCYMYEYDPSKDEWKNAPSEMEKFKAYNILRRDESWSSYYLNGTLNLPGLADADTVKLNCVGRAGGRISGNIAEMSDDAILNNENGDYMFANSWTAPIDVRSMTEDDFTNVVQTIYIFNAGAGRSIQDYINHSGDGEEDDIKRVIGDNPGQWTSLPIASVKANPGLYPITAIPSTQAFLVKAYGAEAEEAYVTLDYEKHVYNPAAVLISEGENLPTTATRAPKREQSNVNLSLLKLSVIGDSLYSDYTIIQEGTSFSTGFDDGWEGSKIFGEDAAPQLYSMCGTAKMAVNAVPDMEGMVVGFRKGSMDNHYNISFTYDGIDTWYLNDLKEQTSTLIDEKNTYEFSSEDEDDVARFVISKSPIVKVPTGVNTADGLPVTGSHKYIINGVLYIIREGKIYNAEGALVK